MDWFLHNLSGEDQRVIDELEKRCVRAEARIVELEGTIAGLRAQLEIMTYPPTAFKEYKAK